MAIPSLKLANGLDVPQLSFGTWKLLEKECVDSVDQALKMGFYHIDTAQVYRNEVEVGTAINNFLKEQSEIKRKNLFVVSKLWKTDFSYDECLKACAASLDKLKLDYLDSYLMHSAHDGKLDSTSAENRKSRHETWRAMEKLLEDGKVRSIGVSNWSSKHLEQLVEDGCKVYPMMNQVEMHPFCFDHDMDKPKSEKNLILEAYSPLAEGRTEVVEHEVVKEAAAKAGGTSAQVLLKWNIQHGNVVVTRSRSKERLQQTLDMLKLEIAPRELALLDGLAADKKFNQRTDIVA